MSDIYDVIYYPDAVLKQVSAPISNITSDVQTQAQKMLDTMYESRGIGLAANQINIANRMFVMDVDPHCWEYVDKDSPVLSIQSTHREGDDMTSNPLVMINPEIIKSSEQKSIYQEGCLSIPGQYANIERPAHITVQYVDINGDQKTWDASGLESHCVQHELDHLNGVLFIDYLSRLKRGTLVRKLEKLKKVEGLI